MIQEIRKFAVGQGGDYTIACLLDYTYFTKHYKFIAIDLSKKQVLDADPKANQVIDFTGNLERDENTIMFFIIEEVKETILNLLQETAKRL